MYIVEDVHNNVLERCKLLKMAKVVLEEHGGKRIIKMRGQASLYVLYRNVDGSYTRHKL